MLFVGALIKVYWRKVTAGPGTSSQIQNKSNKPLLLHESIQLVWFTNKCINNRIGQIRSMYDQSQKSRSVPAFTISELIELSQTYFPWGYSKCSSQNKRIEQFLDFW